MSPWGQSPRASLVGERIGNFRVERLLGEGAMGAVYLGVHDTLKRRVAIKVLQPALAEDPSLVARFVDEARAVSGLGHPGLIQIFDFGVTPDGRTYSVMELLEGEDLEHLLRRQGRLEPWRVARLGAQTADALAAAHEQGIVHRDLKPANLFLTTNASGEEQIKVLDFGIAKLLGLDEADAATRTKAGTVMGTPQYLSPEQAVGRTDLDGRSDMYSLGVVLYELLTGRPPFVGNTIELLVQHAKQPAPPLMQLAPQVPPALAEIVMRCLEKDREHRHGTMRALRIAILSLGAGTPGGPFTGARAVVAPQGSNPGLGVASTLPHDTRPPPTPARRKKQLAVVGVLLAGIATTTTIALMQRRGGSSAGPTQAALGVDAQAATTDADAGRAPPLTPGSPGSAVSTNPFGADDPAVLADGAALWKQHCERCHGARGEGDGKDTPPGLEPKSFADARAVPGLLDLYRFEIIRRGVRVDDKETMPAFAHQLSDDDTWKLVAYVSTLQPTLTAESGAPPPKPKLDRALEKRGAALYRRKCESCHGKRGKGDGPAREYLGRGVWDLTTGIYKLRSTPKGSAPTDEDIFRTVSTGMGVGGMPSFAKLKHDERWALVAFVKTLAPRFDKQQGPPDLLTIPPRPPSSDAARERGRVAFNAAGCAQCHGETGKGDGPKAQRLKDHRDRPIRPPDLSQAFLYIGGAEPEQIFRTMMTGIDGTPMPQGSDFFDEEAWDVVEYILSLQR